jgi:hypothetical protein
VGDNFDWNSQPKREIVVGSGMLMCRLSRSIERRSGEEINGADLQCSDVGIGVADLRSISSQSHLPACRRPCRIADKAGMASGCPGLILCSWQMHYDRSRTALLDSCTTISFSSPPFVVPDYFDIAFRAYDPGFACRAEEFSMSLAESSPLPLPLLLQI